MQCAQTIPHANPQPDTEPTTPFNTKPTTPQPSKPWRCGSCIQLQPALHRCEAAVEYQVPWRGIIARFKNTNTGAQADPALAKLAAQIMLSAPPIVQLLESADLLIPIPSLRSNTLQRGFAPAAEIAKALRAQHKPKPKRTPIRHALRLDHHTLDQQRLNRKQRFANMRKAFSLAPQPTIETQLAGARVVLIDDVITTGATLFAAAHLLQQHGAAEINAVVWARTPL